MLMRILALIASLALASCAKSPTAPGGDSELDRRLLEIAKEYASYGIVDNKFSWVQTLCRPFEPPARHSASTDVETHGNKLYLLYARDWDAYVKGIHAAQPAGQVIVKEAWESRESDKNDMERVGFTDIDGRHSTPETRPVRAAPAQKGDRWHFPTKRHALFIMLKDEGGWKYGTVSGDGARVFQSGLIRSCASCHQKADPDSLFGLPGRPQDR
jgi:hypothetical protein